MNKSILFVFNFLTILFNSCKKDEASSNLDNLKIINNGLILTANFVDALVANYNNTFSFQSLL